MDDKKLMAELYRRDTELHYLRNPRRPGLTAEALYVLFVVAMFVGFAFVCYSGW